MAGFPGFSILHEARVCTCFLAAERRDRALIWLVRWGLTRSLRAQDTSAQLLRKMAPVRHSQ